ncbi:MAG: DUF4157 domain-containing protein [Planctomycetota bacterium]|nr:MAG: DUF4157 domain-containing protein [Planctomycetota bacterium]
MFRARVERMPAAAAQSCPAKVDAALARPRSAPAATGFDLLATAERQERAADRAAERAMGMPAPPAGAVGSSEAVLQPRSTGSVEAPAEVREALAAPGQPLSQETRAFMEPRFGHDFSRVRVHADERASESARAVGARAYTVRGHIVFDRRYYGPGGNAGRRLLAHELEHVVQDDGPSPPLLRRGLQTYIQAMNQKPPDWKLAAKHLNGENPKTIKAILGRLPAHYHVELHRGALPFPGVCSNIARFTEAAFLKAEPGAHKPASEACPRAEAEEKPPLGTGLFEHSVLVETIITQVDGQMFAETFALLDTLTAAELSRTLKELKRVAPGATMVLGAHFEEALALPINWERIMVALDQVEFTAKQRHVDSYMTCEVHPSSFGAGGALTLNITYALTPDRALLLRASEITDEEPSGDELAAQSKTHVGTAGLLFPAKLNKGTVPKLWAAKQRIIREIEIQNFTFVIVAHAGAEAGLGAGQMAAGLIGKLAPVGKGLAPSGRQARWTGTGGARATGTTAAPGGSGVKAAPSKAVATRADVLATAYRGFRGRAGGLTKAEQGGLAKVREYFRLPKAPTKTKKSIVGLLKIYDPDVEPIPLISQKEGGPAGGSSTGSVPRGPGTGFDRYSTGHIEGHAAGKMNDLKAQRGVLLIEKDFCTQCSKNLPQMLPKGSELVVVTPDSTYIVRSSQL